MIAHGAKVKQFHGDGASGLDIIHLLYQQEHARKPRIMTQFDQRYILPDTGAGQVMTAEIRRQEKRREKEERDEREEMEAERLSRPQQLALTSGSRWSRTTAQPHNGRQPPPLPARRPQTEGVVRRQPNPDAMRAAWVVYCQHMTMRDFC